jgi:hypothetical protein
MLHKRKPVIPEAAQPLSGMTVIVCFRRDIRWADMR